MFEVANVQGGTALHYLNPNVPFKIAAKTGTAQVVGIAQTDKKRMREEDMEYYQRSHAWRPMVHTTILGMLSPF